MIPSSEIVVGNRDSVEALMCVVLAGLGSDHGRSELTGWEVGAARLVALDIHYL